MPTFLNFFTPFLNVSTKYCSKLNVGVFAPQPLSLGPVPAPAIAQYCYLFLPQYKVLNGYQYLLLAFFMENDPKVMSVIELLLTRKQPVSYEINH